MRGRIDAQPDRPLAAKLWTATYILMGLQFEAALIDDVLSGVMQMEESVTYQAILNRGLERGLQEGRAMGREEGREEEVAKLILRQGRKKFGPLSAEQEGVLNAITDLARLEALAEKVLDVNTWDELLANG